MKIFITKASIFIIAIILTFNAKAQSDYVITVKGDSIACKISTPMFGGVKYKSAAMSEPENINSDKIKEIYYAESQKLFRAVFINSDKKPTFLTVVEKGKISLYERIVVVYNGMTTTTTTTWYISKDADYVKALKSTGLFFGRNKRKDDFAEMLKDNKIVCDKYLAEDKFSFEKIRNLVHLYNTGQPLRPYAQDYLITKNKDTIFCEIELDAHYNNSRYRLNKKDIFVNIDTNITEYFIGDYNITIVKKNIHNEKADRYVRQLEKGRISLYEQRPAGAHGTAMSYVYANKENDPLVLINVTRPVHGDAGETLEEQKSLIELFADDLTLQKELQEAIKRDYSINTISDYVKRYNLAYLNNNQSAK